MMTRSSMVLLLCSGVFLLFAPQVKAADITDAELLRAANDLAHQYDTNYNRKDAAAMAALYTSDGILVAPSGQIIRGRDALQAYYVKRFASGAHSHAIQVIEVHVQGDGGYVLSEFSVTAPGANGELREVHGHIVSVCRRDSDGWHLRIVEPSIPESAAK
jgi:uncharacterized protein (TIGR02246 family)